MKKIKVICTEFKTEFSHSPIDVDSRMYNEDDSEIMYTKENLSQYHLGQISSSFGWAEHDIKEHFTKELNELFPEEKGEFNFEFTQVRI